MRIWPGSTVVPRKNPMPIDEVAHALFPRESKFQTAVEMWFRDAGCKVYHTWDSQKSEKGFPDLVIVHGNGVIYAELKTEKGEVSVEQADWLLSLANAGEEVYLWRPSDERNILKHIQRLYERTYSPAKGGVYGDTAYGSRRGVTAGTAGRSSTSRK